MTKGKTTRYERQKTELSRALAQLGHLEPESANRARKINEGLVGGFFTLAITGQVKRGKTTLANALLGEELLPVDSLPLTSVVSLIRYGTKRKFVIVFSDGRQEEIRQSQIADYITEERNPRNEKKVQKLEAEYPSEFLARGVVLVEGHEVGRIDGF
ncbi:MAG TPA: dynamin family protein, partial [Candidatus Micrarchaeota archaeon]|nr:dynamin family protein [Candidatus Micrarchaeota archaeon]